MTKDETLKMLLVHFELWNHGDSIFYGEFDYQINAIKEALAQPEQDGKCKYCIDGCPACDARKSPEQEPFMASYEFKQYGYYKDGKGTLKLGNIPATQPPQRTWVGLTEAQCGVLWKTNMTPFEYYQAIEAKLKEKNT